MRRQYRFLLKWLSITVISVMTFNFICDDIVQSVLTGSLPSFGRFSFTDKSSNYEKSIIFWANNGYNPKNQPSKVESIERSDLKLIGAQIIFRHGARTPLHLLPTLEEVTYSKEQIESYKPSTWEVKLIRKVENRVVDEKEVHSALEVKRDAETKLKSVDGVEAFTGQLTSVGERQLYELGKRTRSELIDVDQTNLLPEFYDPETVYCRSTFMNRTVRSARSFLAGVFASDDEKQRVKSKDPFLIEVQDFLTEDLFPNVRVYPILKNCLTCEQLYSSLDKNHDMNQARQKFLERIQYPKYKDGITELYDEIVSRQAHGFPVPEDINELSKDFQVMSARELTFRGTSIGFETFIHATCGRLISLIIKNFQSILENYLKEEKENKPKAYKKFFVYSGHDTTVIPLAMALEIFDMFWPPYASSILIKFYASRTNPNQTYVLVKYRDEPQLLPNCSDFYCPFSTFIDNLKERSEKIKYNDDI